MQARGNHCGVVAEERVAGLQIIRQIAEGAMRHRVRLAVHDQQPRLVAPLRRLLGDEPFRQRVVEKIGGQRSQSAVNTC